MPQQERVIRDVGGGDVRLRNFFRQRQCNYPRTGPEIDDSRFSIQDSRFNQPDKFFRFRSRNERSFVAEKDVPAKLDGAEQMLERLVLPPPTGQLASWRPVGLGPIPPPLQVD